ncbi:MAG: hypothetical protein WC454_00245 [Phycisphaerae bacterium]|jgi:uncharacterized membrane protein
MKKVIAAMVVLTLVLAAVSNGKDSPKGGSVGKGEGFKIDVPSKTKLRQGETQTVNIKLQRGKSFKQDVTLQIEAAKGISVEPAKVVVKASDGPNTQLMITATEDAAIGEYKVSVTGTPTTGEPTSVDFKVKVIALETGRTIQSESSKGGGVGKGEGFKIAVPAFDTKIKQGEIQIVTISLKRGKSFKQDVTLEIKLPKGEGITFDPAKVVVKASDAPDVQLTMTAAKDAALGKYKVSVMGTPATGEPTSVEFKVKVVAP